VTQRPIYDRQLLLLGPKRNAVLELAEIQRYGSDSYGNADYVSIYGLKPADWYAQGIRLLGRTAVECTRDELADAIGKDVAAVANTAATTGRLVIDPFAGSGNTLYWMLRHLPGARGMGFEMDTAVFQLTSQNLRKLRLPVEVLNTDYLGGLAQVSVTAESLVIVFIAPPWGEALSPTAGLDLRGTMPPITEIIDLLARTFKPNRLLCAIQVYEMINQSSLAETKARFDWSALRIYSLNSPGQNHGILLGTNGWTPGERAA
jgi:16S rRNA G966 N2-methylase RsmD